MHSNLVTLIFFNIVVTCSSLLSYSFLIFIIVLRTISFDACEIGKNSSVMQVRTFPFPLSLAVVVVIFRSRLLQKTDGTTKGFNLKEFTKLWAWLRDRTRNNETPKNYQQGAVTFSRLRKATGGNNVTGVQPGTMEEDSSDLLGPCTGQYSPEARRQWEPSVLIHRNWSPGTQIKIKSKDLMQWHSLIYRSLCMPKSLQMVTAAMKLKDTYSLEGKWWPT